MTQEEIAEKIKIAPRTYQAYEAGQTLPRYTTLFKIAKATNTNAMWQQWKNQRYSNLR